MSNNDKTTETCDAQDCTTFKSTTVRFPESESDVERHYCDTHIRHLLDMGVEFEGVSEYA